MNFWRRSLMGRLVGYFFVLSLLIVALAGMLAFIGARAALEQSVINRLTVYASLQQDQLYRWVDQQRRDTEFLARLPEVQALAAVALQENAARARLRTFLTSTLDIKTDLKEILFLSNTGGQVVVSTKRIHEGEYRVQADYFTQGQHGTYVQNVYPSPVSFEPTLTIATPVLGGEDGRLGVLAVNLNLDAFDQIIQERAGLGLSGETYLVDKYNVFLSSTRFGRERFPRGVHTEGINAAIRGEDGAGLYENYEGTPVIGVYGWVAELEVALMVELAQAEAFQPARQIAWLIIGVGLLLAVALALGTFLLARQVAQPVLQVTRTALRVAEGDLTATAPVLTQDEVGVLASTFNDMTARLRSLYADLREEIVERKMAQEEREQFVVELEARNAELERFTYTVSHDLKSPLVTIKGFLGLLEKDLAAGRTDRMKGDIAQISSAADMMNQLLSELLELSRIGRLVNPPEQVPLSELAHEATQLVAGQIDARGVRVTIQPQMPTVLADRLRLLEVFQNLIDNAVKFMGDQAQPRIEIRAQRRSGAVVCCVRDNGIGIAPSYHEKVFGLFERLDGSVEGTGVGLALVRRIVEVHGGRIWVESAGMGQGSAFCFTLPQTEAYLAEEGV